MAKRKAVKKAERTTKGSVPRGTKGKFVSGHGWQETHTRSHQSGERKQAKSGFGLRQVTIGSKKTAIKDSHSMSFKVTRAGKQKDYSIQTGYGYFIPSLRRAENLLQVNELVEIGIPSKEVELIIEYLDLKVPEIARAAAVSPSTVSRWKADTSIGIPGSNQFFRIDEVIRKGVDLFGGLEEFKGWLHSPNLALGNNVPAKLITSHIGVEMVDEALDALHYGTVM